MFTSQIGASDNIGTGCQVDLESRKLRQDSLTTDQYLGWLVMQCMETPRPPKFSLVVFLGLFSISLFVGCATMDSVRKAALGDTSANSAAESASSQPSVYYTAVTGLKLHSGPNAATTVLAELPLHQKVYRYKLERGYAYVEVEGSDKMGWVDNGQLIWRLPVAGETRDVGSSVKKEDKPESTSSTDASDEPKPKERSVFEPY
jgi:hypothetical protein